MRVWVGIAAACLATQTYASDLGSRVEAAFQTWLDTHQVASATLAVMQDGALVHEIGIGHTQDARRDMASLSKAITAVCALSLIREKRWNTDTNLNTVLGQGPDLTVGQLMTHATGLVTDSTQSAMITQLDKPDARLDLEAIYARGVQGAAGQFAYNNENYALLGAMIEAETGENYRTACTKRALTPAGVAANLSPRAGAFAAYGGWSMSAGDYARFHNHHFGPDGTISKQVAALPKIDLGRGVSYGPGMFWRQAKGGANFWHFGALCFPGRHEIGTYAVQWANGVNLVATYDRCVDWDAMGALDRMMVNTVFGDP